MNGFDADSIILALLNGLLLSMIVGMLLVWAWVLRQMWQGRPILPEEPAIRLRQAPWGGVTVFLLFVLYLVVNIGVSGLYMSATGRAPRRARQAEQAKPLPGEMAPKPPALLKAGDDKEMSQVDMLLQLAIINIVLLVSVPLLVHFTSGATLGDFGLSLPGWPRQIALGVCAALFMTPGVIAIQSIAIQVWQYHEHPVQTMMLETFSAGIAFLAVVSTMVLAPMIEELLFRGIFQRWMSRLADQNATSFSADENPDVSHLATDLAGEASGMTLGSDEVNPKHKSSYALDPPGSKTGSSLPIVLTSIFFASMHAPQWPAPIALFVLSLALGAIYQRTGSLLAVIAMHGTFNGFSTLLILLQALSQQIDPQNAAQKAEPLVGLILYLIT